MVACLETFAKVRALHDRTTHAGEKASAAARMKVLAGKAGMTVDQAVSKLDVPQQPPQPRNIFDELFNSPEFRAQKAERERRHAARRIIVLAEYGDENAVWSSNEREEALHLALRPLIVRKPIINGDMDTLQGWDGGRWVSVPAAVKEAVTNAFPAPSCVRDAWAEFQSWEKLADDRIAFSELYDHDVRVRARTAYMEHLLDTMPARSMSDLRGRLGWMEHINQREWNRGNPEDATLLASLRDDIERMGARIREQDGSNLSQSGAVQSGQNGCGGETPPRAPHPVQSGHSRRTNADKRGDVLELIGATEGLTDREIARRAGVSPTTVGTIRRSLA